MDFVVSKVALSICCLLVVMVLSGAFRNASFSDDRYELREILSSLCSTIDRLSISGSQATLVWEIPFMASGSALKIVISHDRISLRSGETTALNRAICDLHTWAWDGEPLNGSVVTERDSMASDLTAESGYRLTLKAMLVEFENEPRILLFVTVGASVVP